MSIKNRIIVGMTLLLSLLLPFNAFSAAAPAYQMTRAEYAKYLEDSPQLKEAEGKLTQVYKRCLETLGEDGAKWLRSEQSKWAKAREESAFPLGKGSAAYINSLIAQANERTEQLNSLIPLGRLITYAAYEPAPASGMNGLLELWEFENNKLRLSINNATKTGSGLCDFQSDNSLVENGVLSFSLPEFPDMRVKLSFADQGFKVNVKADNDGGYCAHGVTLAGEYARRSGFGER